MQSAYLKANDPKIAVQVLMVSDYSFVPTNEKFNFFQDLAEKIPHNIFKDIYLKIFGDCRIHKPKDLVRDVKKINKKKLAQKKREKLKQKREAKSPRPWGPGQASSGAQQNNRNQNRARNHRRIIGRARIRQMIAAADATIAEADELIAAHGPADAGAAEVRPPAANRQNQNNFNNRQQRRVEIVNRPARLRNRNQQNRQRHNNHDNNILDVPNERLRDLIERRVRGVRPRF